MRCFVQVLALVVGCSATSCNQDSANSTAPQSDNKTSSNGADGQANESKGTIGLSVLTLNNPFFGVIGDHMQAEAAKHGYDVIVVSGNQDPNKQLEQVQDFTPTPMTLATVMYYTGIDPHTGKKIYSANTTGKKKLQRTKL